MNSKFESLHQDLKNMQEASKTDQIALRQELRTISDKITIFSENFARLEGLNYGKKIEKLEDEVECVKKEVTDILQFNSYVKGAVAVLFVIATALLGAVVTLIVKSLD